VYVILSGRLRAFGQGDNGKEITYGTYGLGDLVGEMSLDGGPRSASVRAVEDAHCAVITRRTLEQHIAEEPGFAFELLAKVIRLARTATLSTKQLALNDVYGRVKLYLESHALPQADGSLWLAERPTHQQMADSLGCSRPMVTRVMGTLVDGGYVVVEGDGLRLNGRLPMRW
jgi:CRP/FNR family cyclic AMP-dependent transcriptional regulator